MTVRNTMMLIPVFYMMSTGAPTWQICHTGGGGEKHCCFTDPSVCCTIPSGAGITNTSSVCFSTSSNMINVSGAETYTILAAGTTAGYHAHWESTGNYAYEDIWIQFWNMSDVDKKDQSPIHL